MSSLNPKSILSGASALSGAIAPYLPPSWSTTAKITQSLFDFGAYLIGAGVDPIPHVERLRDEHDVVAAALAHADAELATKGTR